MRLGVIDKKDDISLSRQLMRRIDELYTEDPTRGTRRLKGALLRRFQLKVGRGKIRRLMYLATINISHGDN